ncbi:Bdr family repetitive protein (plasmid) [Borreliella sinica]|uniref:Bdr family repetitive protein n=1 Tax=Borreliella sinica TaxID=87162 RepID=UPI003AEF3245
MNNLAYRTYNIESIKNEFLKIGFSEEAIDFVFLHNDNYNFEVLREKMNSLEQQIINVEKNFQKDISRLDTKIDSVKNELNAKIDGVEKSLNAKIDGLEKTLQKDISSLKNELNASNRTIQVMLIAGITLAPIIYSIFNRYFFN